jgi:hypothetical protein
LTCTSGIRSNDDNCYAGLLQKLQIYQSRNDPQQRISARFVLVLAVCPGGPAVRGQIDSMPFVMAGSHWRLDQSLGLTPDFYVQGTDVAILCYHEAVEAEILPPNPKIDDYISNR